MDLMTTKNYSTRRNVDPRQATEERRIRYLNQGRRNRARFSLALIIVASSKEFAEGDRQTKSNLLEAAGFSRLLLSDALLAAGARQRSEWLGAKRRGLPVPWFFKG